MDSRLRGNDKQDDFQFCCRPRGGGDPLGGVVLDSRLRGNDGLRTPAFEGMTNQKTSCRTGGTWSNDPTETESAL